MAPFYGWDSVVSRLQKFLQKFQEIPGTHFIDFGRIKGWLTLEPTSGFEHGTPKVRI